MRENHIQIPTNSPARASHLHNAHEKQEGLNPRHGQQATRAAEPLLFSVAGDGWFTGIEATFLVLRSASGVIHATGLLCCLLRRDVLVLQRTVG